MFQLIVTTHYCGAHSLRGYDGPCARIHGHNFRVEARVSGSKLDDVGMLIDFKHVKKMLKEITDRLDHQMTNDIPPFDTINPTAENVAQFIHQQLAPKIQALGVTLDSIAIFETDSYGAVYTPD